jgi:hypothetical protein
MVMAYGAGGVAQKQVINLKAWVESSCKYDALNYTTCAKLTGLRTFF